MCHSRNNFRIRVGLGSRAREPSRFRLLALLGLAPLTLAGSPGTASGRSEDAAQPRRWSVSVPMRMAILWSAPPRVYSTDVNYEYRQESNLLYLTGIDQEDTILVLMPGNETRKEILFVREADARREHWNGHSLTPAEAAAASGIRDGDDDESVRAVHRGACSRSAPPPRSPTEYARLLPGAHRRARKAGAAARPGDRSVGAAGPGGPVRVQAPRAVLRLHGPGCVADSRRASADQDGVRTERPAPQRRDLE